MITLKQGQTIEGISLSPEEFYSLRLVKYNSCSVCGPLVKGKDVAERARQLNYYNSGGAVKDFEIEGPYKFLHLTRKD